jgi:hypothetical protein
VDEGLETVGTNQGGIPGGGAEIAAATRYIRPGGEVVGLKAVGKDQVTGSDSDVIGAGEGFRVRGGGDGQGDGVDTREFPE